MIRKKTHRYSFLILPSIYFLDSLLIFLFVNSFEFKQPLLLFIVLEVVWFTISYFTKFYEVYRNTKPAEIISKTLKQAIVFDLFFISFFHFLTIHTSDRFLLKNLFLLNISLFILKFFIYILLKYYRAKGGNNRTFIIVGYNEETIKFRNILKTRVDYGFRFDSFFGQGDSKDIKSNYEDLKAYLDQNPVDVIFCSLKECSNEQIKDIINYADNHFINVKFIPDNKEILGKQLKVDYFDYYPVLSLNKSPLDKPVNKVIKRLFDIIFSSCIIVCILSWLTPIIGFLIKLESKGPVFFKQKRNGINYQPFNCYKYRSMHPNSLAHIKQVSKNDNRITKIGKLLRKTSIDELPQFFNVFKGEMSVVGPRPHMIKENERFLKKLDKFMKRHHIKPGITGLAQVKGYRGEVKTDEDIINRLEYDLFYIENWSLWLDIKIILFTVFNIFRGDQKAY